MSLIFNNCLSILSLPYNNSLINIKNNSSQKTDNNCNNISKLQDKNHNNVIEGELYIRSDETNINIALFKTEINDGIDVYLNDKNVYMIREYKKWKYNFQEKGTYKFKIIFNNTIKLLESFFEDCTQLISLDLSNFDTSNTTNMSSMFSGCDRLKEIKLVNKFITNKVINMNGMFKFCNE